VGWESDEEETVADRPGASGAITCRNGSTSGSSHSREAGRAALRAATAADRKAERQARARLVQERAKLIGPLEKRVAELEALVVSLERDRDVAFSALADASAKGDAATIARLSKKSSEVGPRIEWRTVSSTGRRKSSRPPHASSTVARHEPTKSAVLCWQF
jgi:hypothetical protein